MSGGGGGARFPVSGEKEAGLLVEMQRLGIREEDLDETFVHSGGKGGQNVNKVSTCVVLVHGPSGISIKCQEARTQGMNRFLARRWLCEKLEARLLGEKSAKEQAIEKLRRQKRRRSRRAKARVLADKAHQGAKKSMRSRVGSGD